MSDAFNNGMEYFNTFAGGQVACAIGLEVINIVIDEKLRENAQATGKYLKNKLNLLKDKYQVNLYSNRSLETFGDMDS